MSARTGAIACAMTAAACVANPPPASPAPGGTVERDVVLRAGTVHVVVEHDGDDAWARYVADRATAYLPAVERYLDVAFDDAAAVMFHGLDRPWTVRIVGRQRVMLGEVHIAAYNNTYGVFGPDRGIFVEYDRARVGDPAVVLHELTHDWFHGAGGLAPGARRDDNSPAWLIEGLASMTPLAVVESGELPLDAAEQLAIRRHWGQWAIPPAASDVAIAHDPRREGGLGIFYGKAYRVQLIIEHLLGRERYRALLQHIARTQPRTNVAALALLHDAAPEIDWSEVLRGWIFPGPYGPFAPADVPGLSPRR